MAKQEKKKAAVARAKKRLQYNKRYSLDLAGVEPRSFKYYVESMSFPFQMSQIHQCSSWYGRQAYPAQQAASRKVGLEWITIVEEPLLPHPQCNDELTGVLSCTLLRNLMRYGNSRCSLLFAEGLHQRVRQCPGICNRLNRLEPTSKAWKCSLVPDLTAMSSTSGKLGTFTVRHSNVSHFSTERNWGKCAREVGIPKCLVPHAVLINIFVGTKHHGQQCLVV